MVERSQTNATKRYTRRFKLPRKKSLKGDAAYRAADDQATPEQLGRLALPATNR